jgi:3-dehydroquinate synthase
MLAAAEVAVARGAMPAADRDTLASLIAQMGPLPPVGDLAAGDIVESMARDKKVIAGRLHFVLPVGIGRTAVVDDVSTEELAQALQAIGLKR